MLIDLNRWDSACKLTTCRSKAIYKYPLYFSLLNTGQFASLLVYIYFVNITCRLPANYPLLYDPSRCANECFSQKRKSKHLQLDWLCVSYIVLVSVMLHNS